MGIKKGSSFNNAIWIIACKIVQSFLGLILTMLSARYLGPSNYGLINYAASIVAFVTPVMQLGFRQTLVQEFIERKDGEGETLGTAICLNCVSAVACIIGIFTFVSFVNAGETVTHLVCFLYSLNLIFQALEMIQYWFQAKLLSKYTSLTMLCAYMAVSIYKVVLLITGKSVYWFAVSQAIDYMLIAVALFVIYKRVGGQKLSFSWEIAKKMIAKSRYYIISGLMVTIFEQTDRLMLKLMLNDAATGYYSAAVTCAGMTAFVFAAIIDSMRPVILTGKKDHEQNYEKNMVRLYSIIFYLSLVQCICMTVLAEPIIWILYGTEYAPAVNVLRIVVWYTTYAYFGTARNVWILAEGKQKYLWIINLCGAAMNVALNFVLIPMWGIYGAAAASTFTQFFTNFILGFIMKPMRPNNKFLIKGLDVRVVCEEMKKIIRRVRHAKLQK